jgi:two-component system, NtrC family, nitrogen regulation sensor histidine kinase NtrY
MTKSIIEQAKGNIWFETEEGKGTTFFVQLPVIS